MNESIEGLNINPEGIYVDCTTGGAGHSNAILQHLTTGRLICFDKDTDALTVSRERLKEYADRVEFVNSSFFDIKNQLLLLGITQVDGIIADLGVSSYQIDNAERGFSYMKDGPLDMRMDMAQRINAEYIVNNYSEEKLAKIMYEYGEERHSRQIAKKIVSQRKVKPFTTTRELKEVVVSCYPPKDRYKSALSNKVFQAIRIEVNSELDGLSEAVEDMMELLKPNGRISIIAFHPLEDRIIKQLFKHHSTDCICPSEFPICVCNHKADMRLITRKPIKPSQEEQKINTRSISAKLRIIEKI